MDDGPEILLIDDADDAAETVARALAPLHARVKTAADEDALARALGVIQVSSFFPNVPAERYHSPAVVTAIRRAIAVACAVGVIPLFPYDVYAGSQPRWFGTWDEYAEPYEFVRSHRQIFDDYQPKALDEEGGDVVITTVNDETGLELRHVVTAEGAWRVE